MSSTTSHEAPAIAASETIKLPLWKTWLAPYEAAAKQAPVFDNVAFRANSDALRKTSPDDKLFQQGLLALCKQAHSEGKAQLRNLLTENHDGAEYVGKHAVMMDLLISGIADVARRHLFADCPPVSIMATGGYGRGELSPSSDIDLLFILSQKETAKQTKFIEFILYILWDMSLAIGHATRTVDENIKAASEDITIRTALLEIRYIAGDEALTSKMQSSWSKWLSQQSVSTFIEAKLDERERRVNRTGGTRYAVEPNVKDGKGGLRDLHTLFWVAKHAYRFTHVLDVMDTGILRVSEVRSFASAQRFLWTVRCFLHLYHEREDDRLTFDAQREIAPLMGFAGRSGMKGVERFMKRYYLAARHVGNLTRIFCAALETDFSHTRLINPRLNLSKIISVGMNVMLEVSPFTIENKRLQLPAHMRFGDDKLRMIELFSFAQQHQLDIHPDSFRRLTRAVRAAATEDLQSDETKQLFLGIITSKHSAERVLRLMNEAGWLGKFLPDFGRIVGMMQFDMYHSYTVDEHTIRALGTLNEIEQGAVRTEAPMASQLIHEVLSRRALYVTVLLHDIAKGRGGDHSLLGAEVARSLCPQLGLSENETETVIWLIQSHLLMSKTAFRYDLHDPQTISDFASEVQSPERLKLLLILTVADIRAVGPDIWNGWKATLMRDLYRRAEAVLGGAAPSEVSLGAAADAREEARRALPDWSDEMFEEHALLFYPSYWTNFPTDRLVQHTALAKTFNSSNKELLIDIITDKDSKSSILTIMAADHPGLFSRIAGAVAMAECSIVSARINTRHDGTILDEFRVQTKDRQAITDPNIKDRITQLIEKSLAGDMSLFDALQQKSARVTKRVRALKVSPRVLVTNARSRTHTVIEVNGTDRPGLLYQLTYHLAQMGLQVNSASVSTYGEKAVDVFYVKDVFGLQVKREQVQEKIHQALLAILDGGTESKPASASAS